MKFQTEITNILDDNDEVIGVIDSTPPHILFVSKTKELDVDELEAIVNKMKELQDGSST